MKRFITLLVALVLVGLWESPVLAQAGNEGISGTLKKFTPNQARQLVRGLFVVVYPRHASQSTPDGAYVEPTQLGEPVPMMGNPYVIPSVQDWKYPADFNAIATGYLKIDQAGEYSFHARNFYDRNELIVNGQAICKYREFRGGEKVIGKIYLEPGYVPITAIGYVAARGSMQVTWQPPGQQMLQPIPPQLLFFMPPKRTR